MALDGPAPCSVVTEHRPGVTCIQVAGDLDVYSHTQLRTAALDAIDAAPTMMLDLTDTEFADSSGLAAIVTILREARKRDKELVVVCHRPKTLQVLEMCGLDRVLTIVPDAQAWLDGLAPSV